MPDFSGDAALLEEVTTDALAFYLDKGKVHKQTIQDKPMARLLESTAKDFSGGNGNLSVAVKGVFGNGGTNDSLKGFQLADTVNFYNPKGTKRASFVWKEHHIGITFTFTEGKVDGYLFGDGTTSATPDAAGGRKLSGRDRTALVNMIDEKLEDFSEQYARSLVTLGWGDGTADAKALTGIRGFLVDNPATGTLGGIDRATNPWWRNRAFVGANAITADPANGGALLQFWQQEARQLRRFGGKPNIALAGSDYIAALEKEHRANGLYSTTGFKGKQDATMGGVALPGLGIVPEYDPALDDLGLSKRCYVWDTNAISLMKMPGDWKSIHTPARPYNQFVVYRSITCTGQMVARQLNGSGVYAIN
jgi:hypothetical protein